MLEEAKRVASIDGIDVVIVSKCVGRGSVQFLDDNVIEKGKVVM